MGFCPGDFLGPASADSHQGVPGLPPGPADRLSAFFVRHGGDGAAHKHRPVAVLRRIHKFRAGVGKGVCEGFALILVRTAAQGIDPDFLTFETVHHSVQRQLPTSR
ncbi:hypothetical protein SDC9_101841 [bioreactor metagenome]|uniref:Uncharacterized protein n=1 Tax=bioreactor metagenome TaxID=1076179 RepID=A0A645AQ79_9ZZZZ